MLFGCIILEQSLNNKITLKKNLKDGFNFNSFQYSSKTKSSAVMQQN